MSEEEDYTKALEGVLARTQNSELARKAVGVLLIAAFLGAAGWFVYDLLPRRHHLTITGGEITGNRHFLAKVLQEVAADEGVTLKIVPTKGSIQALEMLESGELDLALSQGGLEPGFDDVVHVATLAPELIHFIVKPGIETVHDLRGKVINLGGKAGGTRVVAQSILRSSGLEEGVDYVETNFSNDRIITMRREQLPDVVVNVSFQPSFIADFLVKERGYRLLEIPFPGSLALRMGWVADATVLAYTYGIDPPVPERDIKTVGVNLHLLANANVPPRAVQAVLEALYSPAVASQSRIVLDEENIALPSGFPLSPGTLAFTARKDPLLSPEVMEQLKAAAGLAFSMVSGMLIAVRWFRGKPIREEFHDAEIKTRIAEVAAIERRLIEGRADHEEADRELAALRLGVLERLGSLRLQDSSLVGTLLAAERGARERIAL
ncbi:MAG: ABC transporter substrate-binding protein [Alphaproteobacteria bacterium]|nr:ABC transporter substrate-binding protein [Alphaproteobacteria bacterium]